MDVKDLDKVIIAKGFKFTFREPFMHGVYISGTLEEVLSKEIYLSDKVIAIQPDIKKKEINVFIDHYGMVKERKQNGKEYDDFRNHEFI